ncbi:MAG: ATP-binding protein [Actinomycetota bacterium]
MTTAPDPIGRDGDPGTSEATPVPDAIGLVDGSADTDSRTVQVVLAEDAVVQLDDVVAIATTLPDGTDVVHYGIVTELRSRLEGAELPSDTARYANQQLPAEKVRRAEVRLLRTVPELFVAPDSGSPVQRATGVHRARALFEDEMAEKLPIGLDLTGQPVYADMRFVDGRAGGHASISGVSGVATKTSYALFLLYQLLETDTGIDLLGGPAARASTRALVFNTKGEDLLHIDRPNRFFGEKPDAVQAWQRLGVDSPGPFTSVRLYAPRADTAEGTNVAEVRSRDVTGISAYGWTPEQFVREQLLQFCFTEDDERTTQVGFVEQQVRIQLLRRLRRLAGDTTGAIVIADAPDQNETYNPDRLADREPPETEAGRGTVIRDYGDLIDLLEEIMNTDDDYLHREWFGGTTAGTRQAFLRRLVKMRRRIGPLISCGVTPVDLSERRVHVVDISRLHDDAQRFVVGALLDRVWREKQGTGRLPLRFVVLDELNKYAPAAGFSPLKELLVDIAERGRSLGVLLIGAQQAASAVAPALPRNASLKVAGRLDPSESDAYRFLSAGLRDRATRFMPGTMVASQPTVPEPIPIRFPWPPFATNPDDAAADERAAEDADRISRNLGAFAGTEAPL